ncbi:hypothetical protein AB0H76_17555 [Nocardia sp. NPDC050712]|uniref:hypothetical protein n=1 Tax=Nocardia sp. NPDC050712 TaxID=3155518 RepID=UPI0033D340C7
MLDQTALAALGLELDRHGMETLDLQPRRIHLGRNSFSSNAWAALRLAVDATGIKTRRRAPNHLLRALLSLQPPDPVIQLLSELDIDCATALERLTELEKRHPSGQLSADAGV